MLTKQRICKMTQITETLNTMHVEGGYVFNSWIVMAILLFSFIVATYTDMTSLKIYDRFNMALAVLRIALFPLIPVTGSSLLGWAIGFFVLIIPAMLMMHKMGGDIKFVSIMGTYLGGGLTIVFVLLACIYMLIFSGIRKLQTHQEVRKIATPFAPFFFASFVTIWALFVGGVL